MAIDPSLGRFGAGTGDEIMGANPILDAMRAPQMSMSPALRQLMQMGAQSKAAKPQGSQTAQDVLLGQKRRPDDDAGPVAGALQ